MDHHGSGATVVELVLAAAAAAPDTVLLSDAEHTMTGAQLQASVQALAVSRCGRF